MTRSHIALRSSRLAPRLITSMCLRCAKYIEIGIHIDCDCHLKDGNITKKKCLLCARLHLKCKSVPTAFVKKANRLAALHDAYQTAPDGNDAAELAALRRGQDKFNAGVTVYTIKKARYHVSRKSGSASAVGLLIVGELRKLNKTLTNISDVLLFSSRLPTLFKDYQK